MNSQSSLTPIIPIFHLFYPIVLCIIMITTLRAESQLDYLQRLIPCIILITLSISTTILINIINPYDRIFHSDTIEEGIGKQCIFGSVQLVILLPIIAFVKTRVI